MFTKTTLTAAALATALSAGTATLPISAAHAAPPQIDFNITIDTGNGSISFGTGGYGPTPGPMSCWEAKQYLKGDFKKVNVVECNGSIYTFHVKKFNFGAWKTVKLNSNNGNYWIV